MTASPLPDWEVYALRYATVARHRRDNFMAPPPGDDHDGPMPMDYFVWLLRDGPRGVLVDTGFNVAAAQARRREFLRCPIDALQAFGIAPGQVQDVILTHLHYDHAGNVDRLPQARFHLQEAEMQYATGRYMCLHGLRHAYCVADLKHLLDGLWQDRVVFHRGDTAWAPGIELLHVGGHTLGLQAVRVHTARGWLVLASDAAHFYANAQDEAPFPIVHDVGAMLEGHRRLRALAGDDSRFIPGHDPLVRQRFPAVPGSRGEAVALHLPPVPIPTSIPMT
jgi:glyoxylase-like metal-dependent hydrolase (beta-lactamase superfamily II)